MISVDSSGWLEFFSDGPLAQDYQPFITSPDDLITPTVVLFEVYRVIRRQQSEEEALIAAAQIAQTRLVPLTEALALSAADVSVERGLAMADAIVYATAMGHRAELVTSDADFEGLPGVRYLSKK